MFTKKEKEYIIDGIRWQVIELELNSKSQEFKKALNQANLKAKYTMNASQSGAYRSPEMKFNMQLMGIVAEIGCEEYLKDILYDSNLSDNWQVIRYDDVRTDGFKSPVNEFDLKIESIDNPDNFILIEIRSSITYNRSFIEGLKKFDIIGSYSSIAKKGEKINDIYLRPLYNYLEYDTVRYSKLNFHKLLLENKIILNIVAGCTLEEMQNFGYQKTMSQRGTVYNVLPIMKATDAILFKDKIVKLLQNK